MLAVVFTITVGNRSVSGGIRYELIPFWKLAAILGGRTVLLYELFWNLVLFLPIGGLLAALAPRKKLWIIALYGFLISACIELAQLFSRRGLFEFDDLLVNTLGTVLGALLYRWVRRLLTAGCKHGGAGGESQNPPDGKTKYH